MNIVIVSLAGVATRAKTQIIRSTWSATATCCCISTGTKSRIFKSFKSAYLQHQQLRHFSNSKSKNSKKKVEMSSPTKLQFKSYTNCESDPKSSPVSFLGQLEQLKKVDFEKLEKRLGGRVNREHFQTCLESLSPSPTDSVPLYMNFASLVALPTKTSRHNTKSRAHALSKIVKGVICGSSEESVVLITPREYVLPYTAAVARAFPLYSRKTNKDKEKEKDKDASAPSDKDKDKSHVVNVEFLITEGNPLDDKDLSTMATVAEAVRNAAKIVDMPCNEMGVGEFIEECKTVATKLNVSMEVIRGEELRDQGFGGLWNVGKGSTVERYPALVVLKYKSGVEGARNVAWVGKGIVFDTGGLSIKGRAGMCGMKMDCGGAASILQAFYVAVKAGSVDNINAVLCLAENSVSAESMRVDDVITLYSGKTVEVNNTDAEGRLVLGDGVAYAVKDLSCDIIVDMATLTGAQGIATGKYHAAIVTNNEAYETRFSKAGNVSGDLTFPMPFSPELHFTEFNSGVADMKNSVADRGNAQVSCAGLFIYSHLGNNFSGDTDSSGVWVHVDMASPVESGDRATGYGIVLLNTVFPNKEALFKELTEMI